MASCTPSTSGASMLQQYYVAVGSKKSNILTLVDLLCSLEKQSDKDLAVAIACSCRSSLDETVFTLAQATHMQLAALHADLDESQVARIVQAFQSRESHDGAVSTAVADATAAEDDIFIHPDDQRDGQLSAARAASIDQTMKPGRATVLVTTDSALKNISQTVEPVGTRLLINIDLPSSKEVHLRRIAKLLGPAATATQARAIIHFVIAGQVAEFREVEKFTNAAIQEMPVHAADILA